MLFPRRISLQPPLISPIAARYPLKTSKRLLVLLALALLLACHKKIDPENIVVAQVGDRVITVGDFRKNYECGLPHLKSGPDRKMSYLDYMIKENLLSQEGFKLGLNRSSRVQRLEEDLKNELLVEELFTKEVKDKIKVSPEEIKQAIQKSKVSWKLRYWYEPNKTYADRVCTAMRQRGYTAVVDEILGSNPELNLKPKDFETGYLTDLDTSDELLAAIESLPMGEISDPILMDGVYYIFQVTDIQRKPLTDYELTERADSYRQVLFYRKLNKAATQYVSSIMTPLNLKTKGEPFRCLADAIYEWSKLDSLQHSSLRQAIENATAEQKALYAARELLGQRLATFGKEGWTVAEFLDRFNPMKLKKSFNDRNRLRSALNDEIAMSVRDHVLVDMAKSKKLERSDNVQNTLREWREKWVFEECRKNYSRSIQIGDEDLHRYFNQYSDRYRLRTIDSLQVTWNDDRVKRDAYHNQVVTRLSQVTDSLRSTFPVIVNKAVLDTITTIESKSRWMSLQVFKNSSHRLAVPIVDPGWGL
jgi:hypothetical protein